MHEVDLYWSFRSPYCYLLTSRLADLNRQYEFNVNVKIVLPIELRIIGFFQKANPQLLSYGLLDQRRVADYLGVDFAWPDPDPIVQDLDTGEIAREQPHIYRLVRLGIEAAASGIGLTFIDEVSKLIWSGKERWQQGDALNHAVERAGHWGTPSMVFDGELFFGQDRLDLLMWRMRQRGLKRRNCE
jgi:2-hydroxychromene-2-carboxylate isomerase